MRSRSLSYTHVSDQYYEEIMDKASCLSLVSNAILYGNTIQINDLIEGLRRRGESIDNETLSHLSLR